MKARFILIAGLSAALTGIPAYAQHGRGGGGTAGGMGHSMGHGVDHATSNTNANSASNKGSRGSSVSERLQDNTKLSSKLQSLLPAGTNLSQASQGFKNLGQFVAAVHVSHNLGIPFSELKAKMIGPPSESLGKAIQALKPAVNAKEESSKAEKQAKQDLDDSQKS